MTADSTAGKAQSVAQLMSDSGNSFGRVLKRARSLEQLGERVSRLLPADLTSNCRLANVRDGKMIFACTSAGCATRLRMQASDLLDQLHAAGMNEIEAIEVRMMQSR
jgi:hypothetical protein